MADHRIRFTQPPTDLTKQDLVFEVFIDDEKQGELRMSEGGLDWWPKGAKTNYLTKSWTQLRNFMES